MDLRILAFSRYITIVKSFELRKVISVCRKLKIAKIKSVGSSFGRWQGIATFRTHIRVIRRCVLESLWYLLTREFVDVDVAVVARLQKQHESNRRSHTPCIRNLDRGYLLHAIYLLSVAALFVRLPMGSMDFYFLSLSETSGDDHRAQILFYHFVSVWCFVVRHEKPLESQENYAYLECIK